VQAPDPRALPTEEEVAMPSELSLTAIVERLEAQIEHHHEREAFHAEQEAHHREQRAVHAAELEALTSNLTAFKAAAAMAVELARREVVAFASSPEPPVPDQDIGRKPSLTKMVTRILEVKAPSDVFGTAAIAQEVNQHYGKRLHRPVKEKLVSIVLRRMHAAGKLRQAREGRPHQEALYAKA
jgi:hypothetical protein